MSNEDASIRRKRRSSEIQQLEAIAREAKRRKVDSCLDRAPPSYLATLSKIWLTRAALREQEKISQTRPSQRETLKLRQHRPVTRGFRQELRSRLCSRATPASEYTNRCSPERLRGLKLSAKHGGPDLRDLRGYPPPALPSRYTMSSRRSSRRYRHQDRSERSSSGTHTTQTSTAITKTSRSSGAYDPNFEQRMIDNGIYPHGYEYPDGRVPQKPENYKALHQMMANARPSLSPSRFDEEDFNRFARADAQVSSENRATHKVIPLIQGTARDERCVAGDVPFNNLSNLMRGKYHIAKPDLYYGARPEQLPEGARTKLSHLIEPSATTSRPMAPNFFVEAKGPSGSAAVLRNQACFDGALGARAMHSLQTYDVEAPSYDSNAYTLSSTYHSGQLKMYAHHPSQPDGPGTDPEYHMTQLGAYAMTHNRDTLRQGITAFRNGAQWAEAQRNAAIEYAKAIYDARQGTGHQGGGEDEDEDEEDEAEAEAEYDEDDEDEDKVEDDDGTGIGPMFSSFTSQSSYPVGHRRSHNTVLAPREVSPDELALDSPPRRKATRGWQRYSKRGR